MSLPQTIIAAIFSLTDKAQYGFYVAEEPAMIEAIIEVAELPMTGESYQAVKANLPGLMAPLKAIGVEVVHQGDYVTYFGPGVLKHV